MSQDSITFDDAYMEWMFAGSWSSAMEVVPRLIELVQPETMLDVGCGQGTWARVFRDHGVKVLGIDGHDVGRSILLLDEEEFIVHDLRTPPDPLGRFDLVVSLEVAQYLPPESSSDFVHTLTSHADVVLFSSAAPGQGGNGHLNEQWPSYWLRRFEEEGFAATGDLRWDFWENDSVADWFRQNMLLFARPESLNDAMAPLFGKPVRDVVHPATFERVRAELLGH